MSNVRINSISRMRDSGLRVRGQFAWRAVTGFAQPGSGDLLDAPVVPAVMERDGVSRRDIVEIVDAVQGGPREIPR